MLSLTSISSKYVFKIFIWGGISLDIRSDILFYDDRGMFKHASAQLLVYNSNGPDEGLLKQIRKGMHEKQLTFFLPYFNKKIYSSRNEDCCSIRVHEMEDIGKCKYFNLFSKKFQWK